jgi:hypothetical protein
MVVKVWIRKINALRETPLALDDGVTTEPLEIKYDKTEDVQARNRITELKISMPATSY